ncbi:hypothetical protein [Szabonella alba]|uniref:Phosphoribosyl transferase domain-containing protein n=1 Tax=Szabonella alba TaxID=2804194 RepID=A0A8K0Y1C8_9RHOB|nr:hypothetical protein [Szabonella alba]MBL4918003.1 hypothetical protein [Szabonella alba]
MTSANDSFPERLTKIDALTRVDHHHLREEDDCFFLGEYSARMGFAHSATNNLIINFKKPMDRRGTNQWPYKAAKITQAARALFKAIGASDLRQYTFVPVPPSKFRVDPMYDDRMMSLLNQLSGFVQRNHGYALDIRELVSQTCSTAAVHDGDRRPSPDELAQLYQIDAAQLANVRDRVVICDDVLTTGCHYRAMQSVLSDALPAATFRGVFLARRIPETTNTEDFDW